MEARKEITGTRTPQAEHWMIAAWPGMAGVAQTGAAHLIRTLGLQPVGELPPHDHFDIQAVQVKDGLIGKPRLPKNVFFTGQLPGTKTKLTVFIGEAQPAARAYGFAHELLARAKEMGVDRVATFASLATQLHPSADPSVFAAGTHRALIKDANAQGVKTLVEAQIGGLNGVLLGAAMHRGIPGVCLLAEIPFFAGQIQNPKAAKGVVQAFGRLSGVTFDTGELDEQAKKIDQVLLDMMESMQAQQNGQERQGPEFEFGEASADEIAESAEEDADEIAARLGKTEKPELDMATREKIEKLFEMARKDKSQSSALKRELDAQGVFGQYENRFLDLFRQAE